MKIKLLENMSKTSGTNKSISFELVSEINDDNIYTFDSEFVPFEEATDIFIDTVKPAEDGSGDLILRLYEAKRADTSCCLKFRFPVRSVSLCDMLENETEKMLLEETNGIRLHFHTFEVKTVRVQTL